MEPNIAEQFDALEDKVYALEFAFLALAKALAQADALAPLHLAGALDDMADQIRRSSTQYPPGSPRDLGPVAAQVDSLRDALEELQSHLEE